MNSRSQRSINIGLRNIVATILILLGLIFAWEIRGTLMLTFAAVTLVVLLTMPVRVLVRRFDMNRFVAIAVSVVGLFVAIGLLGTPIMRTMVTQYNVLAYDVIPRGLEQARQSITSEALIELFPPLEGLITGENTDLISDDLVNQVVTQFSDAVGRLGGTVLPVVGGVANTILSALIIFFLSMYLLAEPERYVNGIIKLTPLWYRDRMMTILARIDATLRAWISVTAVSMVVVAVLTGLGLALLGISRVAGAGCSGGARCPSFPTLAPWSR